MPFAVIPRDTQGTVQRVDAPQVTAFFDELKNARDAPVILSPDSIRN
jgi:hypothetical protein